MGQGGKAFIGTQDYIAAVAAVPSIGTAVGYELLAAEAEAPVAAVAGADVDVHLVDEHLYQYRVRPT